jgi:cytochrome P450
MAQLPPGPRAPSVVQTVNWQARPIAFFERCRASYGRRFTVNLLATPPFVFVSDPDEIKQVFTAPADVLHPGEGARILEPILGQNSVILLDGRPHLSQRKLMLPAFHGEKMQKLSGLLTEVSEREVDAWPKGRAITTHPLLQALTLEVILRAVFGLDPGPRLDEMRTKLTKMATESTKPLSALPWLQKDVFARWRRFVALRAETDALIYGLIDERRAEGDAGADRADILSMLLEARHEDGSEMSREELRDELMTLLVAGHETTASSLAWAFERLVREPRVVAELQREIDAGDGDAYLTATVQETLRARPVLPNSAPRLVKQPVEIGGWQYDASSPVCVVPNAYLIHHDPAVYPDPYTFRPERFLDEQPGTYTWIPFGGGRRRCLGASFAQLEMKIVLRAILERSDIVAADGGIERSRRRSITIAPRAGGRTVLRERERVPVRTPEPEPEPAAA